MENLNYNMTFDLIREGRLLAEVHLESSLDFIVFSVTLSLLLKADLAVLNTQISEIDEFNHSRQTAVFCVEIPQLLQNTKKFFYPKSPQSKTAVLQILGSAQTTADIVSILFYTMLGKLM